MLSGLRSLKRGIAAPRGGIAARCPSARLALTRREGHSSVMSLLRARITEDNAEQVGFDLFELLARFTHPVAA